MNLGCNSVPELTRVFVIALPHAFSSSHAARAKKVWVSDGKVALRLRNTIGNSIGDVVESMLNSLAERPCSP